MTTEERKAGQADVIGRRRGKSIAGENGYARCVTNMFQMSIFDFIKDTVSPGEWVDESMLGGELAFEEIAHMVGQMIIISAHTASRLWYKAVQVEKIIGAKEKGNRQLVYYDGHQQRGYINEIYMNKSISWAPRAWRIKA